MAVRGDGVPVLVSVAVVVRLCVIIVGEISPADIIETTTIATSYIRATMALLGLLRMPDRNPYFQQIVSPKGQYIQKAADEIHNRTRTGRKTRARMTNDKAARKKDIAQRRAAQEGTERTAFTEPSIFAYRAMSTGRRRQSERVAPGLGPGPVGGVTER